MLDIYNYFEYTQCLLKKGDVSQVSWLPIRFAVKGRVLKLKNGEDWDNGWVVEECYGTKTEKEIDWYRASWYDIQWE